MDHRYKENDERVEPCWAHNRRYRARGRETIKVVHTTYIYFCWVKIAPEVGWTQRRTANIRILPMDWRYLLTIFEAWLRSCVPVFL